MVSKSWILQRNAQSKTTITIMFLLLQTQASNCNHIFGLKFSVQHETATYLYSANKWLTIRCKFTNYNGFYIFPEGFY